MNIYELYGRKCEEFEESVQQHLGTIRLLKSIKEGKRKLEDVEITDKGWELKGTNNE